MLRSINTAKALPTAVSILPAFTITKIKAMSTASNPEERKSDIQWNIAQVLQRLGKAAAGRPVECSSQATSTTRLKLLLSTR
jgi:hypothetical protein